MTRTKKDTFKPGDVLQDNMWTDRLVVVVKQLDHDMFRTLTLCGASEPNDTMIVYTRRQLVHWFKKWFCT